MNEHDVAELHIRIEREQIECHYDIHIDDKEWARFKELMGQKDFECCDCVWEKFVPECVRGVFSP